VCPCCSSVLPSSNRFTRLSSTTRRRPATPPSTVTSAPSAVSKRLFDTSKLFVERRNKGRCRVQITVAGKSLDLFGPCGEGDGADTGATRLQRMCEPPQPHHISA